MDAHRQCRHHVTDMHRQACTYTHITHITHIIYTDIHIMNGHRVVIFTCRTERWSMRGKGMLVASSTRNASRNVKGASQLVLVLLFVWWWLGKGAPPTSYDGDGGGGGGGMGGGVVVEKGGASQARACYIHPPIHPSIHPTSHHIISGGHHRVLTIKI